MCKLIRYDGEMPILVICDKRRVAINHLDVAVSNKEKAERDIILWSKSLENQIHACMGKIAIEEVGPR